MSNNNNRSVTHAGCPHADCNWTVPADRKDEYEQHKKDKHMSKSIEEKVNEVKYDPDAMVTHYEIEGVRYVVTDVIKCNFKVMVQGTFEGQLYAAHMSSSKNSGIWKIKYDSADKTLRVGSRYFSYANKNSGQSRTLGNNIQPRHIVDYHDQITHNRDMHDMGELEGELDEADIRAEEILEELENEDTVVYECLMPGCEETTTTEKQYRTIRDDCENCGKTRQFERVDR